MLDYHKPVLLEESVDGLLLDKGKRQVIVDLTFGGGGHSRLILEKLGEDSVLFAFDRDKDAVKNVPKDDRFRLFLTDFRYFDKFIRLEGESQIDGVLADFGVSSHQFDEAERGFTYRADAELDMRMNRSQELDAKIVLNEYAEGDLVSVFSKYGEVRNSRQLARKIVEYRKRFAINSTEEFTKCVESVIRGNRMKYLSQVYQAIRIEVNDEMSSLADMLEVAGRVLKKGGRLSAISYHSLEDRLVKNLIKKGNPKGELIKDEYGNIEKGFKEVRKGIITANEDEIKSNPRARSAKLRVAEKIK